MFLSNKNNLHPSSSPPSFALPPPARCRCASPVSLAAFQTPAVPAPGSSLAPPRGSSRVSLNHTRSSHADANKNPPRAGQQSGTLLWRGRARTFLLPRLRASSEPRTSHRAVAGLPTNVTSYPFRRRSTQPTARSSRRLIAYRQSRHFDALSRALHAPSCHARAAAAKLQQESSRRKQGQLGMACCFFGPDFAVGIARDT